MELENDPLNPCVGCGPENPAGLRLRFERDGDVVRSSLAVEPRHVGAPERLHSGLLYLAMMEVANWTVFGTRGRIGLPVRTSALEAKRFVRLGETVRFVGAFRDEKTVAVEAVDEQGALVARLERDFAFPTRAEYMARMGYETLPAVYEGMLPE